MCCILPALVMSTKFGKHKENAPWEKKITSAYNLVFSLINEFTLILYTYINCILEQM